MEFPAGPQILEALAVGGLDFGFTGDTPPVFAQAAGKDIWYAGLEPPKPASSAILVPADSPIRTLADLKGRRIGFQKGSSAHFLVVRGVEKGGLQWSDITPVYLTPSDGRAAFERGALDAWGIWDPYYAAAEIDGRARVLSTGVGLTSNNSYYLASRALTRDARTLKALFDALSEADAWVKAQPHRDRALPVGGQRAAAVHHDPLHRAPHRRPDHAPEGRRHRRPAARGRRVRAPRPHPQADPRRRRGPKA